MTKREVVTAEARTWIMTPFHHEARVKGPQGGVDCGMLLIEIFRNAGLGVPDSVPHYSHDFMMHRGEEWYVETILRFCEELTEDAEILPADVVVWKHGRTFSHGAIVLAWPEVLHAYFPARMVTIDRVDTNPMLRERPHRFFRHRELI